MQIKKVPISKLKAAKYNPRKDLQPGDPAYEHLKKSIDKFGYADPIIWNEKTGNVVGGHQRLKILKDQGAQEVDVSVVNLSNSEEKSFNLALNKIEGQWDNDALAEILEELQMSDLGTEFTGFDDFEIDHILEGMNTDVDGLFEDADKKADEPKYVTCPNCGEKILVE